MCLYIVNLEAYIEKYFHAYGRKQLHTAKLYGVKNSSSSHHKLFSLCIFPDLYTNENIPKTKFGHFFH